MSASALGLLVAVGIVLAVMAAASIWAFVDNRWLYKGRIPPKDENGGWAAPDPHRDTRWWWGGS